MIIKKNIAIILARGGSKGIKKKNLKKVGKFSLLARAIISCKLSRNFTNVFVSTDCDKIAKEATIYNAEVIKRPKNISGDNASSEEGWIHALNFIKNKNHNLRLSLLVQCTSPFIFPKDINKCYQKLLKENLNCCFSVSKDNPFLWSYINSSPRGINHNEKKLRIRRQELPDSFRETGAFYLVNVKQFLLKKNRFLNKMGMLEVENSIDIDTKDDLLLAQSIAKKYDSKIGFVNYSNAVF